MHINDRNTFVSMDGVLVVEGDRLLKVVVFRARPRPLIKMIPTLILILQHAVHLWRHFSIHIAVWVLPLFSELIYGTLVTRFVLLFLGADGIDDGVSPIKSLRPFQIPTLLLSTHFLYLRQNLPLLPPLHLHLQTLKIIHLPLQPPHHLLPKHLISLLFPLTPLPPFIILMVCHTSRLFMRGDAL